MILGLLLGILVALIILAVIGAGRVWVSRRGQKEPEITPYVERSRELW